VYKYCPARLSVAKAVAGGLVGGTAGYVAGAAADDCDALSADHDRGPVSIAVGEDDDVDGEANRPTSVLVSGKRLLSDGNLYVDCTTSWI
jgi:hypothetical protein